MGSLRKLFYSSLFSGVSAGILTIILPIYLSEEFSTSLTSMGVIFSASTLLFVLLQIPAGYLGDRFGRKKVMLASSLFTITSLVFYGAARRVTHFILGKGLEGAGSSLSRAPSNALLIDLSRDGRFSESFGNLVGYFSVGFVLGYGISGWLVGLVGYRLSFIFLILVDLVSLAFVLGVEDASVGRPIKFNIKKFFLKPARNLKVLAVTGFMVCFVENMDYTVTIIFLREVFGASLFQIGFAMGACWLAYGITQMMFGRVVDRRGRRRYYVLGMVLAAASALVLPHTPSIMVFTVFFLILGVGHGISSPAERGILAHSTSAEYRAQDFGFVTTFEMLGPLFGYPILGWMADNLGFATAFYLRAFALFLAAAIVATQIEIRAFHQS